MTEVEGQQWQQQAVEFLRVVPSETPAAKRRRLAKTSVNLNRIATLDHMRCWDHGLRVATGRGLEQFQCKDLLECTVGDDGLVEWPADSGVEPSKCPSFLVTMTDQGSTNLCALGFMQRKLELGIDSFFDPHHRRWNDVVNATGLAGQRTAVVISQNIHNIGYGPFLNSAFFQQLS